MATSGKAHWNTKHGMRGSAEYRVWVSMKDRCCNPRSKDWKNYGARGISVCDIWISSFEAFFADMGVRPRGTTLDRKDNERGYEVDNCRWATPQQQACNRRTPCHNKTGIQGVSFNKRDATFEAYLMRHGKRVPLGRRKDFFEACCLRKSAEARFA